jgi:hypothetical protein
VTAVPLQRLVAVTGVSGSGKSTFARDVLLTNVAAAVSQRSTKAGRDAWHAGERPTWQGCEGKCSGSEVVDRVLEVDQTPIGKTPRSLPGHLHRLLGHHPQALRRHAGGQGAWLRPGALSASTPAKAAAPVAKGRACAPSK